MAEITDIECYCVKMPQAPGSQWFEDVERETLAGTDYYFEDEGYEVLSRNIESLIIKIRTSDGLYGWGQTHAPILPEVGLTIIENLLGPIIVGEDPTQIAILRDKMVNSMNVRGHSSGFMIDAVSGIDIALWDLLGKMTDQSVATLLGGRRRERLPAYVSGLPGTDHSELSDQAANYIEAGFTGVKIYTGKGIDTDLALIEAIRERVGDSGELYVDALWRYSPHEAGILSQGLEDYDVGWLEAPVAPEDINGHRRVNTANSVPVAAGEQLRITADFDQWVEEEALAIAQPDFIWSGITEGARIADLLGSRRIPIAPHVGATLGVGMPATYQIASAMRGFVVQEHQPICFDATNEFLSPELSCRDGAIDVPDGPGLGIDIDEAAMEPYITDSALITE